MLQPLCCLPLISKHYSLISMQSYCLQACRPLQPLTVFIAFATVTCSFSFALPSTFVNLPLRRFTLHSLAAGGGIEPPTFCFKGRERIPTPNTRQYLVESHQAILCYSYSGQESNLHFSTKDSCEDRTHLAKLTVWSNRQTCQGVISKNQQGRSDSNRDQRFWRSPCQPLHHVPISVEQRGVGPLSRHCK